MPWQLNPATAHKRSSLGYATTRWRDDAVDPFAELGYPAKPSGFSAAHYQSTQQSLSVQAKASLALLEDEYRNEALDGADEVAQAEPQTNAHLPFVMDDFGATRKSKLRTHVDASVVQRALAHEEMAETLVVSPITTDEQVADPIVIHPDEPDTEAIEEIPFVELAQPEDANPSPVVMAPVEPELPAVVGGISPEEVAQREAEQFAKGLAQAREEAAAQLAEAVEKAMAEGLAKGLEQGKAEGLAEGVQQGLAQGKEEGLAQGLEQGLAQGLAQGKEEGMSEGEQAARATLTEEMAAQRVLFENASSELNSLIADPQKFFEPLKRLAIHIAEQLVLGELQTSSQAIERLVQRCVDALDHPVHGAVVVELHPDDKKRLEEHSANFIKGMRLEAVHDMQLGSVRVFANDTVVEDLVAHRLEGLAHALLRDVSKWHEQSTLAQPVSENPEEVEDNDVHS